MSVTRRGHRHRFDPAAVVRVAVALVLLVAGPWALVRSTAPTSAAWNNSAYLAAAASSGSWAPAGPGTCQIVSSTAPYVPVTPAPACAVTTLTYADYNDGRPPGSRHANIYFTLSTTVAGNQLVKVSVNLAAAAGIPANWNFVTSGVATGGNVAPYPGFTCAAMASGVFVSLAPSWTGGGGSVFLGELVEDRSETGHTYACTP